MTFIYLSILALNLAGVLLYRRDPFSPARFYIFLYSLLLAVESLKLSPLQSNWSPTAFFLFYGCTLLYLGTVWMVTIADRIHHPLFSYNAVTIREQLRRDALAIDWRWFRIVYGMAIVLFLISFLASAVIVGTIPAFSAQPDIARLQFYSASFLSNVGLFFGPMGIVLGIEMALFAPLTKRQKLLLYGSLTLCILLNVTIMIRGDIFRILFAAVLLYHYGRKNLSMKHMVILFVTMVIVFMLYFFIRTPESLYREFTTSARLNIPFQFAWMSNIYSYVVSNFWNFDFAVRKFIEFDQPYPMGNGFYLLRPLFFFTHTEGVFSTAYGFEGVMLTNIVKFSGLNTILYPWLFYADFGAWGAYGLTFLFGIMLTFFYSNMVRNPTLFRVVIWSLLIYLLFFSFLIWFWSFWFIWVTVAVFALAHKKIRIV